MANTTIEDVLNKHWDSLYFTKYESAKRAMQEYASLTPSNEKYWRERCEAAESVIGNFVLVNKYATDSGQEIYNEWQQLKSTPIPIQTPCGWVKVEDGLPENELAQMVCGRYGKNIIVCSDTAYYSNGRWYDHSNDKMLSMNFITHWMPLPTKPENI